MYGRKSGGAGICAISEINPLFDNDGVEDTGPHVVSRADRDSLTLKTGRASGGG